VRFVWLLFSVSLCTVACAPDQEGGVDTEVPGPTDDVVDDTDVPGPTGTESEDEWAEIDALIETHRSEAHIAGLAVAVTRPGDVVWTQAYGLANVDHNRAATVDTPFMLASVSKTVTGVAVMHASEANALTLEQDINTLLPFSVDNPEVDGETILLRHLVTHTSGIRDNWGNMPYSDGDSPHALGAFLEGYLVEGGAWYDASENFNNTLPGTSFDYGNMATALAGYTVEAATGTAFDDYCDTHLFDVLGMAHTGWHLSDFDPASVAMPYAYTDGEHVAYGHYGYADYPDGQLRSSITDLSRFLAAISNGGEIAEDRILQPETVDALLSPPVPEVDDGQFVFWYRSDVAGRTVFGHNGLDRGVATSMVFSPETGIGVILLMNTDWDTPVGDASDAIMALLFDHAESL
jgi:CubicO group peptidase (beta-lactamase class C family)